MMRGGWRANSERFAGRDWWIGDVASELIRPHVVGFLDQNAQKN